MARLKASNRRRQLLDAALPCFARAGYRRTTTARLAEAAGVTEPILYRHFDSKRDLYAALLDEASDRVVASLRWAAAAGSRAEDRLGRLIDAAAGTGADERLIARAMSEEPAEAEVAAAVLRGTGKVQRFLSAELARLQGNGVVRGDVAAGALARLLMQTAGPSTRKVLAQLLGGGAPSAGSAVGSTTATRPPG